MTTDSRARTVAEGETASVPPSGPCRTTLGPLHPQYGKLCGAR